ncbi:cadmium-translocating P-type ATPase [Candidatus Woesearchaeota archaeon]|nr:cadmium-translocating P-type ATPase [Candidatus Woesearchaeota archaeon]
MKFSELIKDKKFRYLLFSLILIIPFEILSLFSIHFPMWFEIPFFAVIIIAIGRNVLLKGLKSLAQLKFSSINLLMTTAIIGAFYLRELEEAAIIVILFSIGNYLENYGYEQSQKSLEELVKNQPKTALRKNAKKKVPIGEINVGEIIVVKPGDSIPLDGKVIKGRSFVDESAITGESIPADKIKDSTVYAGTLNGNGYLEIYVTKKASETTYSKILQLTEKALETKSRSEQFIEKFAKFYTPMVVTISFLLVIIPVFGFNQSFNRWFKSAITLLVISCPCALVLSTPVTVFSAIGNASRKGILIKGGKYVEEVGKLKVMAFDKTRTLTTGEIRVADIIPFNGFSKKEVLACVAGMESYSEHPIAKGILKKASKDNVTSHKFSNIEFLQGKGMKGECTVCFDKHHCIGNLKFVTQEHKVPKKVLNEIEKLEKEGKTIIISCDRNKVKGLIAVSDTIRQESPQLIKSLKSMGIKSIILSGDSEASVKNVAKELEIKEYKSGLLPQDKVDEIRKLTEKYKHVSMIGDGINDAPALASASVGIAMGAAGADSAIETADVVIMNDKLSLLEYLTKLGRKCAQKIRVNVSLSILSKSLFIIGAIFGFSNLAFAIFADVGVTVIVIFNGLSLFNY